jgi:hypothetical protein
MKISFYSFLLCTFVASAAIADRRITDLPSVMQTEGISGLLKMVAANKIAPPRIPSKWHLEHRTKNYDEKREAIDAREFGFRIVEELEVEELSQRERFADEMLFDQTVMLLDFSDWCVETVGWGNMVLANKCLELAAVASIRLTANTNFPVEKCEKIVSRLSPEWMKPRARASVLNDEARTNLFALAFVESNEELNMACGAGWFLMEFAKKNPPPDFRMPPNKSLNIAAAKSNLDFFEESPYLPNNISLRSSWDYRMFECFRGGFGIHIYREAENILNFRKTIGYFPTKFKKTMEAQEDLERMIKLAEKHGSKVTPVENEPSFDPIKEAFRVAWFNRPNRRISDDGKFITAYKSYKKVITGTYSKHDVP